MTEVLMTVAWADDQDTIVMTRSDATHAEFRGALKTTTAEFAAWLAEQHIRLEDATCGYGRDETVSSLRRAAVLLSAAADKLEEDWD